MNQLQVQKKNEKQKIEIDYASSGNNGYSTSRGSLFPLVKNQAHLVFIRWESRLKKRNITFSIRGLF